MKSIISIKENHRRNSESRRKERRDENGLTPKQQEIKRRVRILELYKQGLNQP